MVDSDASTRITRLAPSPTGAMHLGNARTFLLNYLLKQQKGIWERPDGGMKIRIPLEYDGQVAGFYSKGDTVSSDDRENVNAAYFDWKHAYGNATVYRIDSLKNAGRLKTMPDWQSASSPGV